MLERFLTSALEVIIILDIIGIAAYFILGGIRAKKRQTSQETLLNTDHATTESSPLSPPPLPLNEAAQTFSRVLYGFQKGLG
jgi:hypothetical protein